MEESEIPEGLQSRTGRRAWKRARYPGGCRAGLVAGHGGKRYVRGIAEPDRSQGMEESNMPGGLAEPDRSQCIEGQVMPGRQARVASRRALRSRVYPAFCEALALSGHGRERYTRRLEWMSQSQGIGESGIPRGLQGWTGRRVLKGRSCPEDRQVWRVAGYWRHRSALHFGNTRFP